MLVGCSHKVHLFDAGDELTWSLDDWDWDPIAMLANPKQGVTVQRQTACSSHNVAAANAGRQTLALGGCQLPQREDSVELVESRRPGAVGSSMGCQALCTPEFAELDALLGGSALATAGHRPTSGSPAKAPASEGSTAAPEVWC